MYDNMSAKYPGTNRMVEDLTKRKVNHIVVSKTHAMDYMSEHTASYTNFEEVEMLQSIEMARRIAWRQFAARLGYVDRLNTHIVTIYVSLIDE